MMKKPFIISIAFLLSGLAAIIFAYKIAGDGKVLLTICGTIITANLTYIKYKLDHDRMFKELFESFNKRYDERFNDRFNILIKDPQKYAPQEDRLLIIDYLNFCAEEFLWKKKGRIDSDVWQSWKAGMISIISKKPFNQIYEEERENKASYYGLFEELKLNS